MLNNPVGIRPRLLAYGGTSYTERQRIGDWQQISLGILQDRYGVTGGGVTVGVGLLENRPVLIVRQMQNLWNRGGYPFSLILDPGNAVWRRFGWNGGALAQAILESPAASNVFLVEPDRCSMRLLEQTLLQLQPPVPATATPGDTEASTLWMGALTASEPAVLPGSFSPPALASILQGIPLPFRIGMGFLVSSCTAHGISLGARLVWDSNRPDPCDTRPTMDRGRSVFAAWRSLERQSRARLGELCETPFCQWPDQCWATLDATLALYPALKQPLSLALRRANSYVQKPVVTASAAVDCYSYL